MDDYTPLRSSELGIKTVFKTMYLYIRAHLLLSLKISSFCKMVEGNKYSILFYSNIVWMHGYKRCCRWDLNHQPPPVFPCWYVLFPFYGRKYSMKLKLFMENMWEFFLVFYFVPYKVNIPMHAGELFYVYFLFHTKLIFPCMQGELKGTVQRDGSGRN
jgi:hypothetical protein